ncbi:hypothetical protein RDV89_01655 [Nocardioides zeae]|uniref:DUF7668 domain-containing protein n=1 Tax=Nocardioides imazamoxiresistens TaxID=3231893 RepID=A0ABU3PR98_9ACTN|nr:hypothetical protein [Nocardioides zeae]MDT9591755.1 hypothetical protein [Nocardioides zeae]
MNLDDDDERPVPEAWRSAISELVECLVVRDKSLVSSIPQVEPISWDTWNACLSYMKEYGGTLVTLPQAAWLTSVAIRYDEEWRCLVDLWTSEEGQSDLVLDIRVIDFPDRFEIAVHAIYVP